MLASAKLQVSQKVSTFRVGYAYLIPLPFGLQVQSLKINRILGLHYKKTDTRYYSTKPSYNLHGGIQFRNQNNYAHAYVQPSLQILPPG